MPHQEERDEKTKKKKEASLHFKSIFKTRKKSCVADALSNENIFFGRAKKGLAFLFFRRMMKILFCYDETKV